MRSRMSALTRTVVLTVVVVLTATVAGRSETTRERILREGKIVIGISNGAPWGYRGKDGEPVGFHPDLVRAAFARLGVTKVDMVIAEFGALIPALNANRFDAIAAGLYIAPERCKLVAFSDPDLKLADAALVMKGNPKGIHSYADIAANNEVSFGVGRGSTTAKNALAAGVPQDRTQLFPDIQSNLAALLAGRIDVAAFSAPTVARILSDASISGLERVAPFQGAIGQDRFGYSAIAFRQQDSDLRDLYDMQLRALKSDGTVARIMAKYGFSDEETAPDLKSNELCKGN